MNNISPIIQHTKENGLIYYRQTEIGGLEKCVFTFKDDVYQALTAGELPQKNFEELIIDVTKHRIYIDYAWNFNDEISAYSELVYQQLAINKLIAQNTTDSVLKAELQLTYATENYKCLNDENIVDMIEGYLGDILRYNKSEGMTDENILKFLRNLQMENNIDSLECEMIAPFQFFMFDENVFITDTNDVDTLFLKNEMIKRNALLDQRDGQNIKTHSQIKKCEFHIWLLTHFPHFTFDINKAISNAMETIKTPSVLYIKGDRGEQMKYNRIH